MFEDPLNAKLHKMDVSWFGCNFCSFKSSTKSEQTEHIRQHFNQKFCSACDKSLIQIGDDWYELKLHTDGNCNDLENLEENKFRGNNVKIDLTQESLNGNCSPQEKNLIDENAEHLVLNILSNGNDRQYFAEEVLKIEIAENLEDNLTECNTNKYSDAGSGSHSASCESGTNDSNDSNDVSLADSTTLGATDADNETLESATNKNTEISMDVIKKQKTYKPRNCGHCEKVFMTQEGCDKHLRVKHNIMRTFNCEACNEKFPKIVQLTQHVLAAHNGKPFECRLCSRKFGMKYLLGKHVANSHGISVDGMPLKLIKKKPKTKPKPCKYCGKLISSYKMLSKHLLMKHDVKKSFACSMCEQVFNKITDCFRHINEIHQGYRYKCKICSKLFRKRSSFKSHNELHYRPVTCTLCNKQINPTEIRNRKNYKCETCEEDSNVQSEPEIDKKSEANDVAAAEIAVTNCQVSRKCDHCGKFYSTSSSYHRHLRDKHGITRKFECTACNETFDRQTNLTAHTNTIHEGRRYPCDLCDKNFTTSTKRDKHVRTQHLNQLLMCDICGKQYRGKDSIALHMKIHMQREKFKCEFCERHFIRENSLKVHIKVRHEGKILFECKTCGKSFSTKSGLNMHQDQHLGYHRYVCDYCGHGFHAKSNLSEHINTHTGEKPYTCKICEKTFTQKLQLIAHTRIHTRERPYKCKIGDCKRAYINAIDLKRHRYSTHGVYTKKHTCHLCPKFFMEKKLLRKHLESH